jgi:hypothetical protein
MDGVAGRFALETVKVEAGGIHFLRLCGGVQARKPNLQALEQIRPDSLGVAIMPKGVKRTAPERTDHGTAVRQGLSMCQAILDILEAGL